MNAPTENSVSARLDPLGIAGSSVGLSGLLDELAEQMGSNLAAIDEGGSITYSDLRDRSRALVKALGDMGVSRGERVGLLAGNGIDWLTVAFGTAGAGAVLIPLSTWSTRAELAFLIADADCKVVFVTRDFGGRDFTSDVASVVGTSGPRLIPMGGDGSAVEGDNSTDLSSILADRSASADAQMDKARPDDDAMVLYTSGSTSHPKGVRLTQSGVVENGLHIGDRMGLRPGDRVFVPVPLFWAFGACNALPAAMTHGATLVLPARFEAGQALDLVEQHACTAMYTLPAITSAILRHPDFSIDRVQSLRTGLTIGTPEDFRLATEKLGISELCNVYGATETYGNCAVTWHHWPKSRRDVCQGTVLPGQVIRLRDPDTGKLCADGETGLVEVSGRVSPGYYGQSESANDKAFTDDGFYRTGDLGHLDAEGAFVFVARASEMIKRAGINVSPAEVEDALMQSEWVTAAAVTGALDVDRGECIVAFVVSAEEKLAALQDHCRVVLSKYKQPDHIQIINALPLTATGKLQRKVVREMAVALLADADASKQSATKGAVS
jgi:fatty-acyl-CoA synthase